MTNAERRDVDEAIRAYFDRIMAEAVTDDELAALAAIWAHAPVPATPHPLET